MIALKQHRTYCRPDEHPIIPSKETGLVTRREVASALSKAVRDMRFTPSISMLPREFLNQARGLIQDTLDLLLSECTECKLNVTLTVMISQSRNGEVVRRETFHFSVEAHTLDNFFLDDVNVILEAKVSQFVRNGSNWEIEAVKDLDLHVTRYHTIRQVAGRSNFYHAELQT